MFEMTEKIWILIALLKCGRSCNEIQTGSLLTINVCHLCTGHTGPPGVITITLLLIFCYQPGNIIRASSLNNFYIINEKNDGVTKKSGIGDDDFFK